MEKGKMEKRRQNKSQYLAFLYTTLCRCIQNLKTLALKVPEKSEKKLLERKKNGKNKRNDKHEDAEFLLHNTIGEVVWNSEHFSHKNA